MPSPENMHVDNMIRTEQVVFRNLYLNVCSNIKYQQIHKINEAANLKENRKKGLWGVGVGERKGKGEMV